MGSDIRIIRVGEIEEFANQCLDDLQGNGLLPMTPWRAAAQARNPNADSDDIAMVVARDSKRTVGYLGTFPGVLTSGVGRHKVQFLSTLLVHPAARGQGLAQKLLDTMFAEPGTFILTGASEAAAKVYERYGLPELGVYRSFRCQLDRFHPNRVARAFRRRWPQKSLGPQSSRRNGVLSRLSWATVRVTLRMARLLPPLPSGVEIRRRPLVSAGADELLDRYRKPESFLRDAATLNWMIEHPWIIPASNHTGAIQEAYFFSSTRDEFSYTVDELRGPDAAYGVLVMSFARSGDYGISKLLDHGCEGIETSALLGAAFREALNRRASVLSIPGELATPRISPLLDALGKWEVRRTWCRPENRDMERTLRAIPMSAVDGDLAFT